MKTYFRILRYVRSYWPSLISSLVCILLFTIFSSASLISIIPFVDVIFDNNAQHQTSVIDTQADRSLPESSSKISQIKHTVKNAIYKHILSYNRQDALLRLCILIFMLTFLKNFLDYLQAYMMAYVEQGIIKDIRNDLYRHINALSLDYFNSTRTGHIMSRITNDVTLVNGGVSAGFVTLIKNPILIVAYLIIAFTLSWQLTLTALIVLPLSLGIIGGIGSRLRRASIKSQEKIADVTSILQETITGARVVKAFAMEEYEIKKFQNESFAYFKTLLHVTRVSKLAGPITETLGTLIGISILWFGGQQVFAGNGLSPGEFLLFLLAIFSVMQPIKELSSVNTRLQEAVAAGQRIFNLLDTKPTVYSLPGAQKISAFKKKIHYEGVSFGYDDDSRVLNNINVEVNKGEICAIVGPSGAGKSTLVDLLSRFYDPHKGRILLDGIDLRKIDVQSLRKFMGIVTQETILFHGSIRSNIAYGLEDIPEDKLIDAARVANAHRFIIEFPDGYDTVIGERGVTISGGQRQRLAIARAILKNPPILILDEATSSLDSESELLVQQAIERLMANRTTFVIAHRLSTILHADKIIVLDKGKIVQEGTHEELINGQGIYQRLYQMQFRA